MGRSLLVALSVSLLAVAGARANWPNWLGPGQDRSIDHGEYPVEWNLDNVAWKVEMPDKGTSTPIVWDDRIYVTSPSDGLDTVLAYDLSGNLVWQKALGPEIPGKHQQLGSGSNPSPVTDGQGIFVYFKSGNFAALEPDGTIRWKINLINRFGRQDRFWDEGSSPILTKNHVVKAWLHGGESWIAGFDKETGEMDWKVPRNFDVPTENDQAYTTPLVFEHGGRQALLVWGADHLTAHRASDGSVIWTRGGFNPKSKGYWPPIATPVIADDIAVVPVGRDDKRVGAIHGIRLGGQGDEAKTHRVWKRDDFQIFVPTPAEYQGRAYLVRHRGQVVCLDPATGKTIWKDAFPKSSANYYSSPLIANGNLYVAREDGVVFVANVESGFELVSKNDMQERIIASPVPVRNRLLFRGDDHLFCVSD